MDFQFKIILIAWIILESVHCSTNWLWQCENGYCVKSNEELEREGYASLELCQLICNDYLNVWPKPTAVTSTNKELININTELIVFYYLGPPETADFLKMVSQYFDELLTNKGSFDCKESMYNLKVYLKPSSRNLNLTLDTEESYLLTMDVQGIDLIVNITAPTVFGIRHGMETLFQLLIVNAGDDTKCLSTVSNVSIIDRPKYRHRGLLIDTARNYLSVNTIKKQIEGMALSKLNVLHLHITDSQSFPLVSSRLPNMTKFGAYSPTKIYTEQDIKDLVTFAKVRGVRLLIEIDSPAHAGMGWQWGPQAGLGHLAVCVNKQPWRSFCVQPPCGQLNPVNPKLYPVLTDLYKGIIETTPDTGMFHMGGDEVFIPCWNTTPEILKHLNGKPLTEETYLDLWADYQRKNLAAFDSAIGHEKTSVVVWTSKLTQPDGITKYLPKDRYIIQTWVTKAENDLLTQLLSLGYKLIISTKDKWYLDHGFWGSWGYHKWKAVYDNQMYKKYDKAILGGEVCMWGELVDDSNIDARVWPRASAAAERMWSDPTTKADVAQTRFFAQRERLKARGVHSERVMPAWCVENEGECQTYL